MTELLALFEQNEMPLGLAVDIYENAYVPYFEECYGKEYEKEILKVSYDLKYAVKAKSRDGCRISDWSAASNNILLDQGYLRMFTEPIYALLNAYESLNLLLKLYPDGRACVGQIFYYDQDSRSSDGKYMVVYDNDRIRFIKAP